MDDLDLHDLATENLVLLSQLDQEEFVLQEIGRDTYVQTLICERQFYFGHLRQKSAFKLSKFNK